jgi:hypothetical protein
MKHFKIGWTMKKLWLDEVLWWKHKLKGCPKNQSTLKKKAKTWNNKLKRKFWFPMTILTKKVDEFFPDGYHPQLWSPITIIPQIRFKRVIWECAGDALQHKKHMF